MAEHSSNAVGMGVLLSQRKSVEPQVALHYMIYPNYRLHSPNTDWFLATDSGGGRFHSPCWPDGALGARTVAGENTAQTSTLLSPPQCWLSTSTTVTMVLTQKKEKTQPTPSCSPLHSIGFLLLLKLLACLCQWGPGTIHASKKGISCHPWVAKSCALYH